MSDIYNYLRSFHRQRSNPPVESSIFDECWEVAARLQPKFLRPTENFETARRATEVLKRVIGMGFSVNLFRETLDAEGLLPLDLPFDFSRLKFREFANSDISARIVLPEGNTILVAARYWPAVERSMRLLREAEARAAHFSPPPRRAQRPQPHTPIALSREDAIKALNSYSTMPSEVLLHLIFGEPVESPRRPLENEHGADNVLGNGQVSTWIEAHVRWEREARRGFGFRERFQSTGLPRHLASLGFRDFPNPFEPLLDVLALGLSPLQLFRLDRGPSTLALMIPVE